MSSIIHNFMPLARAIRRAQTGLLDVGIIADSNGVQTDDDSVTTGWFQAWQLKMKEKYGAWASGLLSPASVGGGGIMINGLAGSSSYSTSLTNEHADDLILPDEFTLPGTADTVNAGFNRPWSIPDASSQTASGSKIMADWGSNEIIDRTAAFEWHVHYATFASGAGNFQPHVRRHSTTTFEFLGSTVTTAPLSDVMVDAAYSVGAGNRGGRRLWFEPFKVVSGPGAEGPIFIPFTRMVDPAATKGVATTLFQYQGGLATNAACKSAVDATANSSLAEMLREATVQQVAAGLDPMLLIIVLHGGNDRNQNNRPSWNPSTEDFDGVDSDENEGIYNNTYGLIAKYTEAWQANGASFKPENLIFQLGPYHPQDGFVTTLQGYEGALADVCQQFPTQATRIAGTSLITTNEMIAVDGYQGSGSDTAHLNQAGYYEIIERTIDVAYALALGAGRGVRLPAMAHLPVGGRM